MKGRSSSRSTVRPSAVVTLKEGCSYFNPRVIKKTHEIVFQILRHGHLIPAAVSSCLCPPFVRYHTAFFPDGGGGEYECLTRNISCTGHREAASMQTYADLRANDQEIPNTAPPAYLTTHEFLDDLRMTWVHVTDCSSAFLAADDDRPACLFFPPLMSSIP